MTPLQPCSQMLHDLLEASHLVSFEQLPELVRAAAAKASLHDV